MDGWSAIQRHAARLGVGGIGRAASGRMGRHALGLGLAPTLVDAYPRRFTALRRRRSDVAEESVSPATSTFGPARTER